MARRRVPAHPRGGGKVEGRRDGRPPPPEIRRLVHELGMLVLYEATADLETAPAAVRTPLAPYTGIRLAETIGLVPVLRAGIGMALHVDIESATDQFRDEIIDGTLPELAVGDRGDEGVALGQLVPADQ